MRVSFPSLQTPEGKRKKVRQGKELEKVLELFIEVNRVVRVIVALYGFREASRAAVDIPPIVRQSLLASILSPTSFSDPDVSTSRLSRLYPHFRVPCSCALWALGSRGPQMGEGG